MMINIFAITILVFISFMFGFLIGFIPSDSDESFRYISRFPITQSDLDKKNAEILKLQLEIMKLKNM